MATLQKYDSRLLALSHNFTNCIECALFLIPNAFKILKLLRQKITRAELATSITVEDEHREFTVAYQNLEKQIFV